MMGLAVLFLRHGLRYYMRHKVLALLNIAGIGLGVSVFVAVQIVNHSALQAFRASVDIVAGRANFSIVGESLPFDERIYPAVRDWPEVEACTPVVEGVCLLPDHEGEYLHVLGMDVFTSGRLSTYLILDALRDEASAYDFVSDPWAIGLSESLAARLGVKPGDTLRVRMRGRDAVLNVRFLVRFAEDTPGADEHIAVMDIAAAQELFGLVGKLSRIDCILAAKDGDSEAAVRRAKDGLGLPPYAVARVPDRRGSSVEKMLGAFQLNLTALSLIALMVGTFLIYNTVSTAVVKRRSEIGVLRALGLSRGGVQALFISEALLLGVGGVVLGLAGGVVLAQAMVGVVSKSITALYLLLNIQEVAVSGQSVLLAVLFGMGAVVAGAWIPAREAAGVDPVEALAVGTISEKAERHVGVWALAGLGCLLATGPCLWLALEGGVPWMGFGAAFFVVVAGALLVPGLSWLASRAYGGGQIVARVAFQLFGRSLHRHSVATAALVSALAMVVGVTVMIHGFRKTVADWLAQTVTADVLVIPASNLVAGTVEALSPEAVEAFRKMMPEGADVDTYREIDISFRGRITKLTSCDFRVLQRRNVLPTVNPVPDDYIARARAAGEVLVSENFARKFGVREGEEIVLQTREGDAAFRVAAVIVDYTSERGLVLMDRELYQKKWGDPEITSTVVYLPKGSDDATMLAKVRRALAPKGEFLVYSNRELRREAMAIFDQTFSVTYLLQVIAAMVAGLGIFLSLTILVTERQREIGLLRAAGASRAQVMGVVLVEAVLIAVVGSVLGMASGLGLAAVLTYGINVAFFGWTVGWATPWVVLGWLPVWVLGASMLSAAVPAWRAANLNISEAMRAE